MSNQPQPNQMTDGNEPNLEELAKKPLDAAAYVYGMNLPRLMNLIPQLSKKGATRVLEALVKVPLEEVNFKFQNQVEAEAYSLAASCMHCKMTMELGVYYEQQEKLESETQKQGEENGKE